MVVSIQSTGKNTIIYQSYFPKNITNRAYHVSEVCTESASGLVILHHTVVVEDFSTAFTTRAKEGR